MSEPTSEKATIEIWTIEEDAVGKKRVGFSIRWEGGGGVLNCRVPLGGDIEVAVEGGRLLIAGKHRPDTTPDWDLDR